jgi:hypothetical protein
MGLGSMSARVGSLIAPCAAAAPLSAAGSDEAAP